MRYAAHYFTKEQNTVIRFFDSSSVLAVGSWNYSGAVRYVVPKEIQIDKKSLSLSLSAIGDYLKITRT